MESKKSNIAKNSRRDPKADLDQSVRYVKGVGERLGQVLARKGILSVRDLLRFFPRTYEDRRQIHRISDLKVGMEAGVCGRVRAANPVFYSRSRRRAFEAVIEDPQNSNTLHRLKLTWFSAPYLREKLTSGTLVLVRGEVKNFRGQLQMVHPEMEILGKEWDEENLHPQIVPIYSETEGLFQKTIRKIAQQAARQFSPLIPEVLPDEIRSKYDWPSPAEAYIELHCPKPTVNFDLLKLGKTPSHQRLVYEEFFELALGLAVKRREYKENEGVRLSKPEELWNRLKENLPFRFTNAQRRVLHEVLDDMNSGRVMHRLVQGDVGCGKTVVAAASALIALAEGYQVALMAPTEILTEQHFQNFSKWFAGMNIPLVKLTGSLSAQEKKEVLAQLKTESPLMVFGTHALFEYKVEFAKLGYVIVDEQHRFGVKQRSRLVQKGNHPHLLVMTATPIPRTLALTLYGDLDFSVIDELPPGRKPVQTRVFTEKFRPLLEKEVKREIEKGRQAYIIFPLIEESDRLEAKSIEAMFPQIEEAYSGFKVAFVHGRLSAEEKQSILEDFKSQKISVLVSTVVVEVGVDIPNATVMVIENAERFGLSQLHQLRGRIGRGDAESFCFLMASHLGTPEIVQRLRTMEKVHDGFKLSEVDLEMRGPGEFLGTKQSGLPVFHLARLPRDFELFQRARHDAFEIIHRDPNLQSHPELKRRLDARTQEIQFS